jgi:hypothetical protein
MTPAHITQQNSPTHDQSDSSQTTSQAVQTLSSTSTPPNILIPSIYQPTLRSSTKPVMRSQHGIFKPNKKYIGLHTLVTKSPLPRNPVLALKDPNWKMAMDDE